MSDRITPEAAPSAVQLGSEGKTDAVSAAGSSGALLRVGEVRRPHGTRGEVFVALETDYPDAVFTPGRVLQLGDAEGNPTGGQLTVERGRLFKDGLLLRVAGYESFTPELESLRGASLLIPAAEAAPLAEGEIFYHELVGMRVVVNGVEVGPVRDVFTFPAGDVLAVGRTGQADLLVPFVGPLIREVDRERGVVVIEGPAGLEAL